MTDRTVDLSALLDVPCMARAELRWMWPRVDTYRAADSSWRLLLNRYPGCVIGIAAQLGHRVVGLRWGRPGRVVMVRPPSRRGRCHTAGIAEGRRLAAEEIAAACAAEYDRLARIAIRCYRTGDTAEARRVAAQQRVWRAASDLAREHAEKTTR